MTNLEDALAAVDAGADAVGFVFYEKSPRCVTVEKAREIVEKLPENVEKIGVFVGAAAETIDEISDKVGLTLAQTYPDFRNGVSTPDDRFLEKAHCRVIIALPENLLPQKGFDDPDVIAGFRVSSRFRDRVAAVLLDSGNLDRPGGTGKKGDWEKMLAMAEMMSQFPLRVILAGGLTSENVGHGIALLKPWGVDVASGVEASPRTKDPEKVRAFVRAVREADRKAS